MTVNILNPTKTRLALAAAIRAGKVQGYDWPSGAMVIWYERLTERLVSFRVSELFGAGLAAWKYDGQGEKTPIVLTPDGDAWYDAATAGAA